MVISPRAQKAQLGAAAPREDGSTDAQPSPTTADFIDVSTYQGSVDWNAYAAAGRSMAICRTTKGVNLVDDTVATNRKGLNEHGLYCGLYHFAGWPQTQVIKSAETEADFYLDAVGAMGPKEFPVLDFEQPYGMTPDQQTDWIKKWCVRVEQKTGKTPWIYSNYNMAKLLHSEQLNSYPLWIAHYHTSTLPTTDQWPHPIAWQFTDKGSAPGVSVNVDNSHFYGDLSKLGQPAS